VFGCKNLFEMNSPNKANSAKDTGTLSLRIADSSRQGRTIMPTGETDLFEYFLLEFYDPADEEMEEPLASFERTNTNLSDDIHLKVGSYKLKVYAYTYEENKESGEHAAYGELDIEIVAGETAAEIALAALGVSANTKGIFSWNIAISDEEGSLDDVEVEMEIKLISSPTGSAADKTYDLVDEPNVTTEKGMSDDIELFTGYYYVIFTLKIKSDTTKRPVVWREILHVYENMTSYYDNTFTLKHFINASYDVTYYYNDGRGSGSEFESSTYFYNADYSIEDPEHYTESDYWVFDGWYDNDDAANKTPNAPFTEKYIFDPLPLLTKNIVLTAHWIGIPVLELSSANMSNNKIELSMVLGSGSYPGAEQVTITNTGIEDATGISVELVQSESWFKLNNSAPNTITIGSIAAGSSATFTLDPIASGKGNYTATIYIYYAENDDDPLEIEVEFIVASSLAGLIATGTATATTNFNSNNLINISGSPYGWYAKNVNGKWLTTGIMEYNGGGTYLDTVISDKTQTFNKWRTANGTAPDYAGDIKTADNTVIGTWSIKGTQISGEGHMEVFLNINIPTESVRVYWEEYTKGSLTQTKEHPLGEILVLPTGGDDWVVKIEINSKIAYRWEYEEEYELRYPVFQAGEIYYWKEEGDDFWNIEGEEIIIIEFEPESHNTSGSITIRAYNPTESGVYFKAASPAYISANGTSGLDIQITSLNSSNYVPDSIPLIIGTETVGTIDLRLLNHTLSGTVLTRVDVEVVYNLDPDFASLVESLRCNGNSVNMSTKTINLMNVTHGNISLNTVFTFITP